MLAASMDDHVGRIVVDDFHIGHESDAGMQALKQIVREQGIVGDAPLQGGLERIDVVNPLSREAPFPEEVLGTV